MTTNCPRALAHSPQAFSRRSQGRSRSCPSRSRRAACPRGRGRPRRAPPTRASRRPRRPTCRSGRRPRTPPAARAAAAASRTPAVNAVWLPPPWQAMATRGRAGGVTGRPVATRTSPTSTGCSASRAHSAGRGMRGYRSGRCSIHTWTGDTATRSATSQARASGRVAGCIAASPPTTSAAPETATSAPAPGRYPGTIARYVRGARKWFRPARTIPGPAKRRARSRTSERLERRLSHGPCPTRRTGMPRRR